jgi:hypothetical protein
LLSHYLRTPIDGTIILGYITIPFHALWYLMCLFCWTLMLNFVPDTKIKGALVVSLVASLVVLFIWVPQFAALRTIFFFPFFLFGYYVRKSSFSLLGSKKEKILFLLFFAFVYYLCTVYQFDKKLVSGTTPLYKMGIDVVPGLFLRIILLVVGMFGCVALLKLIPAARTGISKF